MLFLIPVLFEISSALSERFQMRIGGLNRSVRNLMLFIGNVCLRACTISDKQPQLNKWRRAV